MKRLNVEIGRINFHDKFINLSYRYRGNVARIQMQKNINIIDFIIVKKFVFLFINIILVNILKIKIIRYSAIKIMANLLLLYSVLNPETNSLSPSAKSNGVRLSSATVENNHKQNGTKNKKFINIFWEFKIL